MYDLRMRITTKTAHDMEDGKSLEGILRNKVSAKGMGTNCRNLRKIVTSKKRTFRFRIFDILKDGILDSRDCIELDCEFVELNGVKYTSPQLTFFIVSYY